MSPSRFRLRRVFRGPVLRVAAPIIRMNVHPNTITYLSILFAFIAFLSLIITGNQIAFGILVFTVGFLDGVDGAVARASGKSSIQGAFTDSFTDKVAEAIMILAIPMRFSGVMILSLSVDSWAYLCLLGWLLTSYSRSRAESMGVTDLDIGLGARSERLFTLFLFSIVFLIEWGLIVVTVLGLGTAAYRFVVYRNQLKSETLEDLEE